MECIVNGHGKVMVFHFKFYVGTLVIHYLSIYCLCMCMYIVRLYGYKPDVLGQENFILNERLQARLCFKVK